MFFIRLSSCKDATITNHLVGIFADGVSWVLHRLKRHSPLVPLFVFLNNDNHVFKKPLTFISSVRSSSGYHGLIDIRSAAQQPLFQIFQILQILKCLKDPTCAILLKSIQRYQI